VVVDAAFAPFGEQYVNTNSFDSVFTGSAFQDKASDLRDFPFRQYHPIQGRWISPDPAGLAAVDITNPQTWNRYAYARNNPLNAIDPLGLGDENCTWQGSTLNCPAPTVSNDWILNQVYFQWYFGSLDIRRRVPGAGEGLVRRRRRSLIQPLKAA
jgi:RHS repeat-associated protein